MPAALLALGTLQGAQWGTVPWGDTLLLSACCTTGSVPARPIGVMAIMDCFILHLTWGQPKRDVTWGTYYTEFCLQQLLELVTSASHGCGNAGTIPSFSPGTRKRQGNEGQSHQCSSVWDCCWSGKPAGPSSTRHSSPEEGLELPHLCSHRVTEWQHCQAGDTWSREALPAQSHDNTARLQHDSHGKDSPGKHSSICRETGDTAGCVCIHSWLFLRESQIQNRAQSMLWFILALHFIYVYNDILTG